MHLHEAHHESERNLIQNQQKPIQGTEQYKDSSTLHSYCDKFSKHARVKFNSSATHKSLFSIDTISKNYARP